MRNLLFCLSLSAMCVGGLQGASDDPPQNADAWVKIQTTDVPLRSPEQVLSPGLFDRDVQTLVEFPADGKPVDLGLPAGGSERKPLLGAMLQGFVWLDLNANGKRENNEISALAAGQPTQPFVWEAAYADGTAGKYIFRLELVESNKAVVVRLCAKQAKVGVNSQLILVDDSGNGRYDDWLKDGMLVAGMPPNLLSRQVYIEGKLHELLVHPAGQTIELRPLTGIETGTVDLFHSYVPPQKSESLKIHTLIVAGRDGAFAFDAKLRSMPVPAGSYDLVFGLFERASEQVVLKKGEQTSFNVEAAGLATPKWGGPVSAKFDVQSDGKQITVGQPSFVGVGSEIYVPQDLEKIPVRAYLTLIYRDQRMRNVERYEPMAQKKYEAETDKRRVKPVVFEWMKDDDLQVSVEYKSGILGTVITKERIVFIHRRR